MRRVFNNKRKFILRQSRGYTLIELIVVMGITGLLLTLTFGGYSSTRKEKYMSHVANLTQTNIRDTLIDIVSTKTENVGNCRASDGTQKSPQIKAVRIQLGNTSSTPVSRVAMCINNSNVLGNVDVVEANIDPSSGLNYKQDVRVTCDKCVGLITSPAPAATGYLYLAFTSPYGKYYSYYTSETVSTTADTKFKSDLGWTRGTNLIYYPLGTTLNRDLIVTFDSNLSDPKGIVHKITISQNGNVKLD